MKSIALAVDLGGTNIKAGLVDEAGVLHDYLITATGLDLSEEAVADRLSHIISDLKSKADAQGYTVSGIGVGVPGGVYEDRATISQAPNFPSWRDVPMKQFLEERIELPVLLDNDANLAAYGESWMGAGRDVDSMILLTLGTGIGGGVILDGKIWRGAWGMAGEIGHVTVERDGPLCGCGNNGCLEALAGKNAIIEEAYRMVTDGKSPTLETLVQGNADRIVPETIFQAACKGCVASRLLFEKMGENIGIVCASLLNVLGVEKFILGGGMSGAYEFIYGSVVQEIRRRAYRIPADRVRVEKALLGNKAGVLGAGRMVINI